MCNDRKNTIPSVNGRDGIFAKSSKTSWQRGQLWNSQNPECGATSPPNRKIPAILVPPCVQNVPEKIGEASSAGYTYTKRKASQKAFKDQVEWPHLRPCLVPSWCGASRFFWKCCWPRTYESRTCFIQRVDVCWIQTVITTIQK